MGNQMTGASRDSYDAAEYWSGLVSSDAGLRNVAYPWLAESLNGYLYRAMADAALAALGHSGRRELRGADVLDIGCGTGVWTALWDRLGAARVVGLDLSAAAVERLRHQQPKGEFLHGDIGDAEPVLVGQFDLVSAMSVLLHITDDVRFERAVKNVANLLAPGGSLLLMDPVVVHTWWGRPFDAKSNSKARSLDTWRRVLGKNGLELVEIMPVTCLLANPADTKRRLSYRALSFWWRVLEAVVRDSEQAGRFVGSGVYHIDRVLLRFVHTGPSTKVLIVRHQDDRAI
jgi:SAM-dependent methyltransferase